MARSVHYISRSKKRLTLLAALIVALAAGVAALAYFTSTGSGTATASVGSLGSPAPVAATTTGHLTWSAVSSPSGTASDVTYTVTRDGGSGFVAASGSCAGSLSQSTISCDDTVPASGSYVYKVTAHFRTWTSSATSASVSVDQTAPTSAITFPTAGTAYNNAGWNAGCTSAICGTAADETGGSGLANVKVSIQGPGGYWNGTDFTGSSEQKFTATGTGSWSLSFAAANFATSGGGDGSYTVKSYATDNDGNVQTPATSKTFSVDNTSPSNALSLTTKSGGGSFLSGSTLYYQGSAAGAFKLQNAVSDPGGSGPASSTFADFGGTSTGWTHTAPDAQTTPSGGPYVSNAFSWASSTTSSPTETVTGADVAGNTTPTTLTLTNDSTAPAGGALTVNGTAAIGAGTSSYSNTGSFSVDFRIDYTDGGSGLASSVLTRETATLSSTNGIANGSCGAFGNATTIIGSPPQLLTGPTCYRYTLTGTDNVGNTASISTIVKVDTSAPSAPTITLSSATGNTYINGTSVYINPQTGFSGSFQASATSTDNDSGIQKINFPTLSGFTSGGGDDATSPYSSGTYSWSGATATASGTQTVTSYNNASSSATGSFTVTPDTNAPSGGALTVNGTAANGAGTSSYSNTGSFSVDFRIDYTDGGSGLASSVLTRETATLSSTNGIANGSCGAFGNATTIIGSPPQLLTGPTCYRYTLTGTDNVGNTASISTIVKVDTTGPSAPTPTLSAATGNTFVSGTTAYINAQAGKSGSFTVTSSPTDNDSGILNVLFPSLTGFTSGGGTVSSSPYTTTYSWSGAVGASGAQTITATNNAGSTNTANFTVTPDTAAPTGGALVVNGSSANGAGTTTFSGTTSFTIDSRTDYTDSGSGIDTSTLTVQSFGLSNGTCGAATTPFSTPTTISGTTQPSGIATDRCYTYALTGTDRVGNATNISTTVKVDTTAPTGGSITANGSGSTSFNTSGTVSLSKTDFTDTDSGMASNVITRATATLSGNTCGSFSSAVVVSTPSDTVSTTACYQYTLTGTNNAGGTATATSAIVKVDLSGPTFAITASGANVSTNGTNQVYFKNVANGGSFTITASDPDSGISSSTFSSVACPVNWTRSSTTTSETCTQPNATNAAAGSMSVSATNNASTVTNLTVTVTLDTTGPTNNLSLAPGAVGAFMSGNTVFYKSNAAGSFNMVDTVTDALSGAASATFPAIGTTGWTHNVETISTPAGGPFTSSLWSWTAGPNAPAGKNVTSLDNVGNSSGNTAVTFTADTTAPTGTITFPVDGTTYTSGDWTGSITGTASDAGSGVGAINVSIKDNATGFCADATGAFTVASCTTNFVLATGTTSWSLAEAASNLTIGHSYTATVQTTDNVGNVNSTADTSTWTYALTQNVPLFQAIGTPATWTANGSVTANYPTGTTTNDLVILFLCNNQENGKAVGTTPTSGGTWTAAADSGGIGTKNAANSMHCQVFTHTVTGPADASVTFTVANVITAAGGEAWVIDYRKPSGTAAAIDGTNTDQVQTGTTSTFSPAPVAVTTAPANEIHLVASLTASSLALTTPGGFTLDGTNTVTPLGGLTVTLGAASAIRTATTAPATPTWTGAPAVWYGDFAPWK